MRPARTAATRTFALVVSLVAAAAARAETARDLTTFPSGGKDIRVERFQPKAKGKYPAVLLLAGADGVDAKHQDYRGYCRLLAERGYVALLVHYLDRTGMTEARDRKVIDQHYLLWLRTVGDAVGFAAGLDNVDARRVGLLGFSLGSYLSLSLASTSGKERVAVVVEFCGGLTDLPFCNLKGMPPTLILHGEKDDVVEVKEARRLAKLLQEQDVFHEMTIYEKEGHIFSAGGAEDATRRVFKFFDKHLRK